MPFTLKERRTYDAGRRVVELEYRLKGNSMTTQPLPADLPHHLTSRSRLRTPAWLALAGLLLATAALPAAAQELGRLKQITGPSPFAGCTADDVGSQDGTNYPESEIEPWIDANPADARNLIAGWQQDRWSNGGSRGDISAYTDDGGITWNTVLVPKTTACSDGPYKRASDPWVSFAPDGTAYYFTLAFDPDLPSGAFGPNALLVSRSTDGGASWGDPIVIKKDGAGQVLNDKNALTADPNNPHFAYAVWDRLRDFTLPPGSTSAKGAVKATAGAGDGVVAARQRAKQLAELAKSGRQPTEVFFKGPAFLSRTTDGGASWEPIQKIHDPGANAQTINNLVAVPPSGTVFDFFTEISPNGGTRIGFVRSLDKGATFDKARYAATIATVFGSITPDTQELVRDAAILYDVAADPNNGNLYLVWQDVRFSGVDEIAFAMSTDGGLSWSNPVRINKTPRNRNVLRQQAILPTIAVGPKGRLVVTYYDYRFDTDDGHESLDDWAIICNASQLDCRKPANWGVELRLTNRSFDILKAPEAGGFFLGDYMGLVAARANVFPAFGIVDGKQKTSIFTRKIRLGGTITAAE
jgi:hypothetical protein